MSNTYEPDSVVYRAESNQAAQLKSGTPVFIFHGEHLGLPRLRSAHVCTSGDIMEYCSVILDGNTAELWLPKIRVYLSEASAWSALAEYAHSQCANKI